MTKRLLSAVFIILILLAGCTDSADLVDQADETTTPAQTSEPQNEQTAQPQQTPDAIPKAAPSSAPAASVSPAPEAQTNYTAYSDYSYADIFAYLPASFNHLFLEDTVQIVSIGHRNEVPYIRINYTDDIMVTSDFERFKQHVLSYEEITQQNLYGENGEIITESAIYTMYPYWEGGYQVQAELSRPLEDETKQIYFNDELFDYDGIKLPDAILDLVADEEALFLYNSAVYSAELQIPNIKTLSIWINLGEQEAKQVVGHYVALLSERELFEYLTHDDGLISIIAQLDEYRIIHIYARPPHNGYSGYQLQIITEYFFDSYEPTPIENE